MPLIATITGLVLASYALITLCSDGSICTCGVLNSRMSAPPEKYWEPPVTTMAFTASFSRASFSTSIRPRRIAWPRPLTGGLLKVMTATKSWMAEVTGMRDFLIFRQWGEVASAFMRARAHQRCRLAGNESWDGDVCRGDKQRSKFCYVKYYFCCANRCYRRHKPNASVSQNLNLSHCSRNFLYDSTRALGLRWRADEAYATARLNRSSFTIRNLFDQAFSRHWRMVQRVVRPWRDLPWSDGWATPNARAMPFAR